LMRSSKHSWIGPGFAASPSRSNFISQSPKVTCQALRTVKDQACCGSARALTAVQSLAGQASSQYISEVRIAAAPSKDSVRVSSLGGDSVSLPRKVSPPTHKDTPGDLSRQPRRPWLQQLTQPGTEHLATRRRRRQLVGWWASKARNTTQQQRHPTLQVGEAARGTKTQPQSSSPPAQRCRSSMGRQLSDCGGRGWSGCLRRLVGLHGTQQWRLRRLVGWWASTARSNTQQRR